MDALGEKGGWVKLQISKSGSISINHTIIIVPLRCIKPAVRKILGPHHMATSSATSNIIHSAVAEITAKLEIPLMHNIDIRN